MQQKPRAVRDCLQTPGPRGRGLPPAQGEVQPPELGGHLVAAARSVALCYGSPSKKRMQILTFNRGIEMKTFGQQLSLMDVSPGEPVDVVGTQKQWTLAGGPAGTGVEPAGSRLGLPLLSSKPLLAPPACLRALGTTHSPRDCPLPQPARFSLPLPLPSPLPFSFPSLDVKVPHLLSHSKRHPPLD